MDGGVPGFPWTLWGDTAVAGFALDEEIAAIDRYGTRKDDGLARIHTLASVAKVPDFENGSNNKYLTSQSKRSRTSS
jgi:hypothetical protein